VALDSIIRKAVKVAHKVTKPVQGFVQHVTWTGQDGLGDESTVIVLRQCLIEQKLHQRKLSDGRVVQIEATLTFLEVIPPNGSAHRVEPVDPKDTFILPDGSSGSIIDTEGLHDPGAARPFVLQVFLGHVTGGVR
jgi:hypothetical protein